MQSKQPSVMLEALRTLADLKVDYTTIKYLGNKIIIELTVADTIPIDASMFTTKSYNILMAAKINNLASLSQYSQADLLKFRNSGPVFLEEVESVLKKHKLALSEK